MKTKATAVGQESKRSEGLSEVLPWGTARMTCHWWHGQTP